MAIISPAQITDGTTIDAADVNNPINTIANEFNGNIDNNNIKVAAAIDGAKLADTSIPTAKLVESSGLVPAGSIVAFAGTTAPTNYFICDGTAKSRTTYAALFAITGTLYGVGDGSTTFNIPDLRGRVPVGKNTGTFTTIGGTGGEETHTLTVAEMPSHSHNVQYSGVTDAASGNVRTELTNNASISTSSTGGGGAHNNLQPYQVINYIIRY